ncbi:hypothetical protein V2S66_12065 [Streptomyces sp. V4-01]|uniref:Uncharacterized protein n=1 Tax=Actinacidiphila polyblastidii TaxID=3110430 RepID=A0ABU7PA56_9ACTN|nr:hypothetical protein [Streptomyces sp. V4-01]
MTTTPDRHAPGERTGDHGDTDVRLPQQHTADHAEGGPAPGEPAQQDAAAADAAGEPSGGSAPVAAPAGPRMRDAPRWVRWTVLPLLVLVPLGYVIISAEQSRDGGAIKEQEAAARHMTPELPSSLQQRIYQVPFPVGATAAGYLETNSWDISVLYAQFTTTAGGLDTFLAKIGTSRDALHDGHAALAPAEVGATGWDLSDAGPWAGVSLHQLGDKPDHDIAVDLSDAEAPVVYVVSTVNFQHGFGGG